MKSFHEWRQERFLESSDYSAEEMEVANKTCRSSGAVGKKALVPEIVKGLADPKHKILDFGSGTHALHAQSLKDLGLHVTAHEFGKNVTKGLHNPNALKKKYDIVYASNVLNVQDNDFMLSRTLDQIKNATKPNGRVVVNLPVSPRKGAWVGDKTDLVKLQSELEKRFSVVKRDGLIFHASEPK